MLDQQSTTITSSTASASSSLQSITGIQEDLQRATADAKILEAENAMLKWAAGILATLFVAFAVDDVGHRAGAW